MPGRFTCERIAWLYVTMRSLPVCGIRDVEAEAGSGHILMEAEARKICRFRIIQKSILEITY